MDNILYKNQNSEIAKKCYKKTCSDVLIAKLYVINYERMHIILDSFKVLNNKRSEFVEAIKDCAK